MQINFPKSHYNPSRQVKLAPRASLKFKPDEIQSLLHPPKPTLIERTGNFAEKIIDNVIGPLAGLALIIAIPAALVANQEGGKAQQMEMELLHKAPDKVGYFLEKGNEYQKTTGFAGNILASKQYFYSSVLDSLDGGKSTPLTTFFKVVKK